MENRSIAKKFSELAQTQQTVQTNKLVKLRGKAKNIRDQIRQQKKLHPNDDANQLWTRVGQGKNSALIEEHLTTIATQCYAHLSQDLSDRYQYALAADLITQPLLNEIVDELGRLTHLVGQAAKQQRNDKQMRMYKQTHNYHTNTK